MCAGAADSQDFNPGWRFAHTPPISAGGESKFTSAWIWSSLCCQGLLIFYRWVLNAYISKDRIFIICLHVIHALGRSEIGISRNEITALEPGTVEG